MKKIVLLFSLLSFIATSAIGQVSEVELVVNATGNTKEVAINNALRSAIEQSFGTFVSSNTVLLNDDLVKDEIVTISNGTIKKYSELSSILLPNGLYAVSINAIVSLQKLTEYAKNHGSSCELAGAVIGANIKKEHLYEENERKVIDNLISQISMIKDIVDVEMAIGNADANGINIELTLKATQNLQMISEIVFNTMAAIGLDKDAIDSRESLGLKVYENNFLTNCDASGNHYITIFTRNKYVYGNYSYMYFEDIFSDLIDIKLNDFRVSSNISTPVNYSIKCIKIVKGDLYYVEPPYTYQYKIYQVYQGHPILKCECAHPSKPNTIWSFPKNTKLLLHKDSIFRILSKGTSLKYSNMSGKLLAKVVWTYSIKEDELNQLTNFYIEPIPQIDHDLDIEQNIKNMTSRY